MVRRVRRQRDVKMAVEEGLKQLGYTVYPQDTGYLQPMECVVRYTGYDHEIITTESYWDSVEIVILYNEDNNNEMPIHIVEILENVTKYVEDSGVPSCTSFKFTRVIPYPNGESTRVEIYATYDFEVDWIDNNN